MLKHIYLHKIKPHPNNPRHDLGDLGELAKSISAQGIMQNLTVVPCDVKAYQANHNAYDGDYVTIIGHRRREAAMIAGLNRVPCSVVLLSERDQIAAMLAENLQRTDLTLAEQGQGFQMMLDLGVDFKSIAAKTGISEKTIKKKVRIVTAIGIEQMKKVRGRNVTLEDYERLLKINCQSKRGEVLEKIGTRDFDWCVEAALREQEKESDRLNFMHKLSAFSMPVPRAETQRDDVLDRIVFSKYDEMDSEMLDNAYEKADEGTEFIHHYCDTQEVVLLCIVPTAVKRASEAVKKGLFPEDDAGDDKTVPPINELEVRAKQIDERANEELRIYKAVLASEDAKARKYKLRAKFAQAREMRMSFARKFRITNETKNAVDTMLLYSLLQTGSQSAANLKEVFGNLGWESNDFDDREDAIGKLVRAYDKGRSNLAFLAAYCRMEQPKEYAAATEDDGMNYRRSAKLLRLYEHLGALGYVISEEEEQLFNGTHPLFTGVKQ